MNDPTLAHLGRPTVTDGGLETDLIFHHGVDLPEFAAFPLLDDARGRALLSAYYDGYAAIARAAGAGLLLESPTWRANPDWGARVGYDADRLHAVNVTAIHWLREQADRYATTGTDPSVVGTIGPRGDGYVHGADVSGDEAAAYHRPQVHAFAQAGADLVTAYTLTDPGEAVGVVRAARAEGLPVAVSFTVETDGRLPDGITLAAAMRQVDEQAPPDYFLVNCAHPTHVAAALSDDLPVERIRGLRVNSSTRSHAELDEAPDLDEGDLPTLARTHDALRTALPAVSIVGGCCGTDARHVAALWGV